MEVSKYFLLACMLALGACGEENFLIGAPVPDVGNPEGIEVRNPGNPPDSQKFENEEEDDSQGDGELEEDEEFQGDDGAQSRQEQSYFITTGIDPLAYNPSADSLVINEVDDSENPSLPHTGVRRVYVPDYRYPDHPTARLAR